MYHHHVLLTDLQLSTTYYYAVGDSAGGFSAVNSFTTAAGTGTTSFTIVGATLGFVCGMRAYYRLTLPRCRCVSTAIARPCTVILDTVPTATVWRRVPSWTVCTTTTTSCITSGCVGLFSPWLSDPLSHSRTRPHTASPPRRSYALLPTYDLHGGCGRGGLAPGGPVMCGRCGGCGHRHPLCWLKTRTRPARCLQDISYADDAYKHFPDVFSYETVYNDFMNWMQNITARKVWRALFTLPANRHSTVFS